MLRFCFSSFVAVLLLFGSVFAQTQEKPFQETPVMLALIAELHQLVESLPNNETVNEKIVALFQLLDVELVIADKQPAQNTIRQILALVPLVEKESRQTQILEAVAIAQAYLGNYEQSVKTLDLIVKPSVRAEKQLNVAEKIIEDLEKNNTDKNETTKQFDVIDLLRKSLAGAVEAKDAGLESLASVILAQELAKQGKDEESTILFEKARKKAREIEEIEEQNLVAFMIRSLIQVNRQAEALALVETINDEDGKMLLLGQAAISLAHEGKFTDATNLVKIMKQNEIKDNTVIKIIQDTVKTITVEQILELAKLTGSPEFRNQLLQNTINILSENKRNDIVGELVKHLENVPENQLIFQQYHLKLLIDNQKIAEAAKFIETFDIALRQSAVQYLFMTAVQQQGELTEELLNLVSATYSGEEKKKIESLQQEAENVLKNKNTPEEQLAGLFQVLQLQINLESQEIFDPRGILKTLGKTLELTDKLNDPCKIVQSRLGIADIQRRLHDKSGAKKNLNRLLQFLDGIKDVSVFKDLLPDESAQPKPAVSETTPPPQPVVRLNSSADETAGNNNLCYIYVAITEIWYGIDEYEEAKKSFQKALQLANKELNTVRKIEKLIALLVIFHNNYDSP
ncbi:MAG: hypothetical protein LBC20_14625 [Planctomycetaceae bacterium]|jgi:tetratricopeptide (TPR) repeat protein|nr:hypothetical protein [Planctomycetaceae bacterium]